MWEIAALPLQCSSVLCCAKSQLLITAYTNKKAVFTQLTFHIGVAQKTAILSCPKTCTAILKCQAA